MRELLLPPTCGGCGARGPSPCAVCWSRLGPAPDGPLPPHLDDLVAVLAYDGPGRELVARLKYRNQRGALEWLATALGQRLEPTLGPAGAAAVVTWAPTTPARRRSRGFDQAELLARRTAIQVGARAEALLRRLPGPAQTGRSAAARRAGKPVFVAAGRRGGLPPIVVIVDDVVTSGATLDAAAQVVRAAGAERVVGAVAARTPARPTLHVWTACGSVVASRGQSQAKRPT